MCWKEIGEMGPISAFNILKHVAGIKNSSNLKMLKSKLTLNHRHVLPEEYFAQYESSFPALHPSLQSLLYQSQTCSFLFKTQLNFLCTVYGYKSYNDMC
jgi:hypothetical protein